jgi:transposase
MTRTSRAEWVKRVERWRESKLSAEAFAAQLGIKATRLRHWDWKLKQRRPETSQAASQPAVPPARASSFIELSAALPVDRSPIEIVTPRGYVLRVPPDVDQKLLERVLEVVR